jgi:ferredoxin
MIVISGDDLRGLAADLLATGSTVWGPARVEGTPRRGRAEYRQLADASELDLDAGLPLVPLKRVFLPPTEPLFWWRRQGAEVTIIPPPAPAGKVFVIGARPCDAAGAEAMDRVMGWDYRDEPWFQRREAATVVTVACDEPADEACFCGDVGLGPAHPRGSDLLLVGRPGGYLVEEITDKGRSLVAAFPQRFHEDPRGELPEAPGADAGRIDLEAVSGWLSDHFEDESWNEIALRCHGCGACASVCPACHCFDIVDEPDNLLAGTRRRNWDSCQVSRFTVHASGHNPREGQHARVRQRVMHKFRVFPNRFGRVLCTGCGRCTRACPAGQDIFEILTTVAAKAASAQGGTPAL